MGMGDEGYAAPSQGYEQPSAGYGAPASDYGAPVYEPSAPSHAGDDEGKFDLDKILELLPFFLAVFAAIIVAQLFAPLLGMLFDLKVGLLSPLAGTKLGLINSLLTPLNLAICDTSVNPIVVAGTTGRGFDATNDQIAMISQMAFKAFEAYNNIQ